MIPPREFLTSISKELTVRTNSFLIVFAAKVISNRPGVAGNGTTPGQASIPDVGVYGSAANLAPGGVKINVDSKLNISLNFDRTGSE